MKCESHKQKLVKKIRKKNKQIKNNFIKLWILNTESEPRK